MLTSVIRTLVPILVGAILSLGVVQAAGVDAEQLTLAVTALLTVAGQVVYYVLARFLEQRFPRAGVLLGSRRQPSYPTSETVVTFAGGGIDEDALISAIRAAIRRSGGDVQRTLGS